MHKLSSCVLDVPQCSVSQQVARHVSQKVASLEESNTECIAVMYVRHILLTDDCMQSTVNVQNIRICDNCCQWKLFVEML